MSRPKGSVNKKKIVEIQVKEINVPRVTKEDVPQLVCLCGHLDELHYGKEVKYCNAQDCPCLEFK